MSKPLLTDEIIEEAQQEEAWSQRPDIEGDLEEREIYKSRRIENAKRGAFQSKLNKALWVIILLIALLVYAMFNL